MKETDLNYVFFDSISVEELNRKIKENSQENLIEKNEIVFEQNNFDEAIDSLNTHFSLKDKINCQDSVELASDDLNIDNDKKVAMEDSLENLDSAKDEEDFLESDNKILNKSLDNEKIVDKKEKPQKQTFIGAKLITIISIIVIFSMGLITFLVSYFVTKDTRINAEMNNYTINSRTSSDCEYRINSLISNVMFFCDLLNFDEKTYEESLLEASQFFLRNENVISISLFNSKINFTNKSQLVKNNATESLVEQYIQTEKSCIQKLTDGQTKILNASPFFSKPLIAIFVKTQVSFKDEIVVILYSIESLSESFSTGKINESIFINDEGIVLIHPDNQKILDATDFSNNVFIKEILSKNIDGIQKNFVDSNGIEYFAVSKKITNANCRVVTQIKIDTILAAIRDTTRRNIALTIAILSMAVFVIWLFSKTLSRPLAKLTDVINEINSGNFNTLLFNKLDIKRRDEIGILNRSAKKERDILNSITSLTNKGVTNAIIQKNIDFEPHLKDITIFFSDIRGFTLISDGFNKVYGDKSAAEIISFLNDYMSRMVNCITITGGVVDKFEGDAIMASWGVLRDDNLDYEMLPDSNSQKRLLKKEHEKNIRQDALNSIKSTLAMRYALMEYNKAAFEFSRLHENDLDVKYKPQIRIGAGINSGRATVGFMGSKEKMEFTSIGDAVNLASRTESSNKPCGTDILITQNTLYLLRDYVRADFNNYHISDENKINEIIVEKIPATFEVKGKGKQSFYAVVNMPMFDIEEFFKTTDPDFVIDEDCAKAVGKNGPMSLSEVRDLLDIPTPDFEVVDLDEEENKVNIV